MLEGVGENCGGDRYKIKPENQVEYEKEIDNPCNLPIELPPLSITIDDVGNTQYTDDKDNWYTPVEFYKLEKFFKKLSDSVDSSVK